MLGIVIGLEFHEDDEALALHDRSSAFAAVRDSISELIADPGNAP